MSLPRDAAVGAGALYTLFGVASNLAAVTRGRQEANQLEDLHEENKRLRQALSQTEVNYSKALSETRQELAESKREYDDLFEVFMNAIRERQQCRDEIERLKRELLFMTKDKKAEELKVHFACLEIKELSERCAAYEKS